MKKLLALTGLCVLLTPLAAQADMIVTTKSGKQYRLPVDGADISSIRFTNTTNRPKPRPVRSNWSGRWNTSEGRMSLTQRGTTVRGRYSQDSGRISGQVRGNKLIGVWAEKSSARRCDTQKMGSFYWGRIVYTQTSRQQFTGKWGYCDDRPSENWTGKR